MKWKRQRTASSTPKSVAKLKKPQGSNAAKDLRKPYLPYEMIFKILCYLPVESLLRFRTVCRLWHNIIQDPRFIRKHMKRQAGPNIVCNIDHFDPDTPELWTILCFLHGLQLETCNSTQTYRIKNPSTKQVLTLPPPPNNFVLIITICFISTSNQYKVVYMYLDELTNDRLGCKVLTIGTDSSWRSIYIPKTSYDPEFDKLKDYVIINEIFYVTKHSELGDSQLICIEMEKEQAEQLNVPLHLFSDRDSTFWPLRWNTALSYVNIVKQKLHVWILEDYKKKTWSSNQLDLPLNFLKDFPDLSDEDIDICAVSDGILLFIIEGEHAIFYSIESGSVKYKTSAPPGKKLLFTNNMSTLVSLSGMQPDVA